MQMVYLGNDFKGQSEGPRRVKLGRGKGNIGTHHRAGHQCKWLVLYVGTLWRVYRGIRRRSIFPWAPGLLRLGVTPQSMSTCTLLGCTFVSVKQVPAGIPPQELRGAPRQEDRWLVQAWRVHCQWRAEWNLWNSLPEMWAEAKKVRDGECDVWCKELSGYQEKPTV